MRFVEFLLVILIICFICWYTKNKLTVEYNTSRFDFGTWDNFNECIDLSEYFKNINNNDLERYGFSNKAEYLNKYLSAYKEFTADQKMRLIKLTHECIKMLPLKIDLHWYYIMVKSNVIEETISPHCMGRGRTTSIIIPETVFDQPDAVIRVIILHEIFHLYQRANPADVDILANMMGFINCKNTPPVHYKSYSNPDASKRSYCIMRNNDKWLLTRRLYDRYQEKDVLVNGNKSEPAYFDIGLDHQGDVHEIQAEVFARYILKMGVRSDWQEALNKWCKLANI